MKGFVATKKKGTLLTALVLLGAACSFQKFDYLKDHDSGSGGSAPSAGGSSSSDGGEPQGGDDNSGGTGESGGSGSKGGSTSGGDGGTGGTGGTVTGAGGGGTSNGGTAGSAQGGMGATGELVNPSFETTNTNGWTVEPADALTKRHAFVQYPVGEAVVPEGHYEFSTWHGTDAFVVDLYQNIKGLEDGTYTFKGYFSRGDALNAVSIYARNCGGEVDPEPVPVPLTGPTEWLAVEITGIEVVGGDCEVGLHIDSNPADWLNADLFSFELEEAE